MPEFWYIYLIPLVGIVAAVAYSQLARAQIAAAVATGGGSVLFAQSHRCGLANRTWLAHPPTRKCSRFASR